MRLAALYDIHGNLPALEAVLAEALKIGVDEVLVGGDTVPGPMPVETLDRLLSLEIPTRFITGNCEVETRDVLAGKELTTVPPRLWPAFRWVAEQLGPEHLAAIASWPLTLTVPIAGFGEVLFCHATPRDVNEVFSVRTAEELLLPIFDGLGAAAVVCGHTHMQFDRMIGGTRVMNAGSVGMPFGPPGAFWLLFDPEPELRCTPYDLSAAARRVRAGGYPDAESFASTYILNPSPEDEILELFSKSEVKPA